MIVAAALCLSLAGCVEGALSKRDEAALTPAAAAWAVEEHRAPAFPWGAIFDFGVPLGLFGALSLLASALTPRRNGRGLASSPRYYVIPNGDVPGSTVAMPDGTEIILPPAMPEAVAIPDAPAVCGFCGRLGSVARTCPGCGADTPSTVLPVFPPKDIQR